MKCCYFVKSISFHFPRIFIYNHTIFRFTLSDETSSFTTSDKCPAFRSTRRCPYQIPRENMSHLIKFFCSPVLREIRGRIRMCTVRKHTKLKWPRPSCLDPVSLSFFIRLIQSCVYAQCYQNSVKNILYTIRVRIKTIHVLGLRREGRFCSIVDYEKVINLHP